MLHGAAPESHSLMVKVMHLDWTAEIHRGRLLPDENDCQREAAAARLRAQGANQAAEFGFQFASATPSAIWRRSGAAWCDYPSTANLGFLDQGMRFAQLLGLLLALVLSSSDWPCDEPQLKRKLVRPHGMAAQLQVDSTRVPPTWSSAQAAQSGTWIEVGQGPEV
mmetsp:Transcript_26712/g.69092  ORF Transcript_26712/g.69092 Transcript_26712/m.69092 type:complete len:165 (-) Transcript_26712:1620-2114(-)